MTKKTNKVVDSSTQVEKVRPLVCNQTIDKHALRAEKYQPVRLRSYRSPIRTKSTTVFCPVPVEQRFAKEFNKKANGWPASDISRLIQSSSELEIQNLVNKFVSASENLKSRQNLTVEQQYLMTKPRYVDTAFEREQYFNFVSSTMGLSPDDLFKLSSDYAESQKSSNPEPSGED